MDRHLTHFIRQWTAVALASLVPVVLAAFIGIPLALGQHPGEQPALQAAAPASPSPQAPAERHMT